MSRILVIEDTEALREEILLLLQLEDFDVCGANDGQEGVQMAISDPPDLIVCDIMMPEMDGYEVVKSLREHESTTLIPVIFLTARASREDIRTGMNLGVEDYLTKPFTATELLHAIRARLKRSAELRAIYQQGMKQASTKSQEREPLEFVTQLPDQNSLLRSMREANDANKDGHTFGLIVSNIDRFRQVNTALGFDSGDQVLRILAKRHQDLLLENAPEDAKLFALGGARFGMFFPNFDSVDHLTSIADYSVQSLRRPIAMGQNDIRLSCSIGGTTWNKMGAKEDLRTALLQANEAVFQARNLGPNSSYILGPHQHVDPTSRLTTERHLFRALEQNELRVHYQPKVELDTGSIYGVEALVRWNSPELGPVAPGQFIPIAEENGLIHEIGAWVIEQACMQAKEWERDGFSVRCAVNLSSRHWEDNKVEEIVLDIIDKTSLNPNLLCLELTESGLIQNTSEVIPILKRFRDLGIWISVDDFGTGFSSLAYVKQFPMDELKVDRTFVRGLPDDTDDEAIATAIIQMGHSLGLHIVAEGVETEAQLEWVKTHGCHGFQGYFFSKPVPAEEITRMLKSS